MESQVRCSFLDAAAEEVRLEGLEWLEQEIFVIWAVSVYYE